MRATAKSLNYIPSPQLKEGPDILRLQLPETYIAWPKDENSYKCNSLMGKTVIIVLICKSHIHSRYKYM